MSRPLNVRFLGLTFGGRLISKILGSVQNIDKVLLEKCENTYQGEQAFFAVDASYQGLGFGRQLFSHAVAYMKDQKITSFYLFTNTTCNYNFYKHMGLKRVCEQSMNLNVQGQQNKMTFFIYEYQC